MGCSPFAPISPYCYSKLLSLRVKGLGAQELGMNFMLYYNILKCVVLYHIILHFYICLRSEVEGLGSSG